MNKNSEAFSLRLKLNLDVGMGVIGFVVMWEKNVG